MQFNIPQNEHVTKMTTVVTAYRSRFKQFSASEQITLKNLIGEYDSDLVVLAIIETAETGATHNAIHMIMTKLEKWQRIGITTVGELEVARRKQLQKYTSSSSGQAETA